MAYNLGWLSNSVASFSDTFASTQNPISSPWVRNATNFQSVKTTGGAAYAAGYCDAPTMPTDNLDAYALLSTSAFLSPTGDYEVTATWIRNNFGLATNETEILLRGTDTGSTCSFYEFLLNNGGGEIVQINGGGPGNFVEFQGGANPQSLYTIGAWEGTGDKVKVRVTGTNPVRIQAWHAPASTGIFNATAFLDISDSSANRKTSGQPGIGFYNKTADGNLANCGWQDISIVAV